MTLESELRPGDFFVSRSNSGSFLKRALPALVRFITKSKWNHAGIYTGAGQVIEAQPGGVRFWEVKDYLGDDTLWSKGKFIPEVPGDGYGQLPEPILTERGLAFTADDVREDVVDAAIALLGTKYGLLDCIALGLAQDRLHNRADVRKAINEQPWWVRRLMSEETLICSELVDLAYSKAGVHLFTDGRLPMFVSPADLGELLGDR